MQPNDLGSRWMRLQFTTARRKSFYKDIGNAYASGIPPITAVRRLHDVSRGRRSLKWLVNILSRVLADCAAGASFSKAVSKWVPPEDAALLSVGEDTGEIDHSLRQLVSLLESRERVSGALMTHLVPSTIMLIALTILVVVMMLKFAPQVKEMVPADVLRTLSTLPYYIAVGDWLMKWGILTAAIITVVCVSVAVSLSLWRPDGVREFLDRWVLPYTLYTRLQAVYLLIATSAMLNAGRPFRTAIEQIEKFATPWARGYLRQMLARLRAGRHEIEAIQVGMMPPDVADRLNFYAELPSFVTVMQEVARDAIETLIVRVGRIGFVLRVLMMILLAIFILGTLMSMFEMGDGVEKAMRMNATRGV